MKNLVFIWPNPNFFSPDHQVSNIDGTAYLRNASQLIYNLDFSQVGFEMIGNVICYFCLLTFICHFHENLKETVPIFGMPTPVCSWNHMPSYQLLSLPSVQQRQLLLIKFLMKGEQNSFWEHSLPCTEIRQSRVSPSGTNSWQYWWCNGSSSENQLLPPTPHCIYNAF